MKTGGLSESGKPDLVEIFGDDGMVMGEETLNQKHEEGGSSSVSECIPG